MNEPDRPAAGEYNEYYHKYIQRVPEGDIRMILRAQLPDTMALLRPLSHEQAAFRYAAGKWSVKQVIGHMADTERVFAYRALRIARTDVTPLPSFDENLFAEQGGFDERPLQSLLAEFEATRAATGALFQSFSDDAWKRSGTASNFPVSVRALAYIIAGHELHHRGLLQERYLTS